MSLVSFSNISDGTGIDAADVNNPLNTIYDDYNGNIDNSNIAASAAIAGTKLADSAITTAKIAVETVHAADGWVELSEPWTYASASTFTVPGDQTAKYTKGTRLKFTQSTVKYATVASSTFGASTTVTIIVNTDFVLANAAISANYYSYAANPQGYPTWFNYSPTFTGFSVNPTAALYRFNAVGNWITVSFRASTNGTSNAPTFTATLPVAAVTLTNAVWFATGLIADNGVTAAGSSTVSSGGTTIFFYTGTAATGGWTGSGGKGTRAFTFEYEF